MPGQVAQMFEQALDAIKGWFHLSALDKSAPLEPTLLTGATSVPAGRVAHLNNSGQFELGGSGTQMPIFLWNGKDHPDVYNDGTSPVTSVVHWYGISPTGVMSGLVATGGYELQTTEYDSTLTYTPNQFLTASATGVLTNASVSTYVTWICGLTSWHVQGKQQDAAATSPEGTNAHGVSTLTFWTYFLPGVAVDPWA